MLVYSTVSSLIWRGSTWYASAEALEQCMWTCIHSPPSPSSSHHLLYVYTCRVQDHFAHYPAHGLLATTHLVLKHPSGEKLSFALKWGIPAVSDRCVCVGGREGGRDVEREGVGGVFNVLVVWCTFFSTPSLPLPSLFPPSSLLPPAVGYLLVQQPRRLFQWTTIS